MALLIRTSDCAAFCHTADPEVDPTRAPPGWDAAAIGGWVPAAGQPSAATRVVVRPLSALDVAAARAPWDDVAKDAPPHQQDAAADASAACWWGGVVSIDGAQIGAHEVEPGIRVAIVRLIAQVSSGVLGPLGRC